MSREKKTEYSCFFFIDRRRFWSDVLNVGLYRSTLCTVVCVLVCGTIVYKTRLSPVHSCRVKNTQMKQWYRSLVCGVACSWRDPLGHHAARGSVPFLHVNTPCLVTRYRVPGIRALAVCSSRQKDTEIERVSSQAYRFFLKVFFFEHTYSIHTCMCHEY